VVEMLTTTPTRCPANCEKTSANGVSGLGAITATGGAAGAGAGGAGSGAGGAAGVGAVGAVGVGAGVGAGAGACARPGIAGISSRVTASNAAGVAPRRPNMLTIVSFAPGGVPALAARGSRSNAGVSDALDMKWRRYWQDGIET
jgi:hypothetical protein